jgi:DNA ligase-1
MLVFDGMPVENWKAQYCPYSWHARRSTLDVVFSGSNYTYFELLPVLYQGTDTSKILELLESEIARNQEGIMINIADKPYEFKRTTALLKVKKMNTLDLEIVGYEEGNGRLKGTLGALHVRYKNGNIVKVTYGDKDGLTVTPYKTFILNYNNFAVTVNYEIDGAEKVYTIPANGYVVIQH